MEVVFMLLKRIGIVALALEMVLSALSCGKQEAEIEIINSKQQTEKIRTRIIPKKMWFKMKVMKMRKRLLMKNQFL